MPVLGAIYVPMAWRGKVSDTPLPSVPLQVRSLEQAVQLYRPTVGQAPRVLHGFPSVPQRPG